MTYTPVRPGYPTKFQSSCWQGLFIVVKCLGGNTYRIKHAKGKCSREIVINFVFLQELLFLCHPHPCNPEDAASALNQSGQMKDSTIREYTPSHNTQTRASKGPRTNIATPSVPTVHLKEGSFFESCPTKLPSELCRGERSHKPPQRYADCTTSFPWERGCRLYWAPDPSDNDEQWHVVTLSPFNTILSFLLFPNERRVWQSWVRRQLRHPHELETESLLRTESLVESFVFQTLC